MKNTFFTIIIATHKRYKLLERAIVSVLNQKFNNNQFIVVSDVEDLDTYKVVSRLLRENDIFIQRTGLPGPAESRNIALQLAQGSHVIFLDDDDEFHPSFLYDIANVNEINCHNKILYVNGEVVDELNNESIQKLNMSMFNSKELFVKNFIPNNCVVYPAEIAKRIKFNDGIAYEDWHYLLSAISYGDLVHVPIFGPIINKNSELNSKTRGEINNSAVKLINCYREIYRSFPSDDEDIINKRKSLFNSVGLDFDEIMKDRCE